MKKILERVLMLCVLGVLVQACSEYSEEDFPQVTTNGVISYTETTVETGGTVTSEGMGEVVKRGICLNATGDPSVADSIKTVDGSGTGTFRSLLTGLKPATKYYYRAYATNQAGTAYGASYFFITKTLKTAPVVSTLPISDVELTSANCGGMVSDNGGDSIYRCGICWDVNPDPTTASSGKVVLNYTDPVFNCSLTGLAFSTKYYVRAFAVNSKGVSYGENSSFTTKVMPDFVLLPVTGGTFQMGSASGALDEQPVHWVTLSNFKMAAKEVTVELWNAVMPNSENRNLPNNLPVRGVSFNDAMTFITRLCLATNKNYRLPTEAEWEYVAGEGTGARTVYAAGFNDTLAFAERAWYWTNADLDVHPVGTLLPNNLGFFDLAGNVQEWCNDWYGEYATPNVTNPKGASSGTKKVLRGGSYSDAAGNCRTSQRRFLEPNKIAATNGFRIALSE